MDIRKLKHYDIVTFEDDTKILVLETVSLNGKDYAFVNEIPNDEAGLTDVYKVMEIHVDDNSLEKVTDYKIMFEIMPILYKKLKNRFNDLVV